MDDWSADVEQARWLCCSVSVRTIGCCRWT